MNQRMTLCPTRSTAPECTKSRPAVVSRRNDERIKLQQRKDSASRAGFGTLEVVIIIAVLLSIALIFRASLTRYAESMIQAVLGDQSVIDDLADDKTTID